MLTFREAVFCLFQGRDIMKLDIISIMKDVGASIRFEMTENIEAFETGIGTVYFTSPVTVKGTATNLNRMIEIKAEAQIDYRTVCDRCGEPLERQDRKSTL